MYVCSLYEKFVKGNRDDTTWFDDYTSPLMRIVGQRTNATFGQKQRWKNRLSSATSNPESYMCVCHSILNEFVYAILVEGMLRKCKLVVAERLF